jgi:hypothetical protein
MFWWHKAALLLREGRIRAFGFITTNSLTQKNCRRVLEYHLGAAANPLSLAFAVPDHPWVDSSEGAAVRIAMTVGQRGRLPGRLLRVAGETTDADGAARVDLTFFQGAINPDLTVGVDLTTALPLKANAGLCSPGVKLHGAGFIVAPEEARSLGLGRITGLERHLRHYRNGRDLAGKSRGVMVIDLFGLTAQEVRDRFPEGYQWVLERVKPERDLNNRATYAQNWWIFGEPRKDLRPALDGLTRFIATVETSKHRFFVFLGQEILPDNMLVNFGLPDGFFLGVLSSLIHVTWSLAAGGRQGVGNDPRYTKSRCFDTFPFPDCDEAARASIRELAEKLDATRKQRQALHPGLTLTDLYNVVEKLRTGETLNAKDRSTNEQGLAEVVLQLHQELDRAVLAAYGWPQDLPEQDVLGRLLALNKQRRAEEQAGLVRWLRPEFQSPNEVPGGPATAATQGALDLVQEGELEAPTPGPVARGSKQPWPETVPQQILAVRERLATLAARATAEQVAAGFKGRRSDRVFELLETLVVLGQATRLTDGYQLVME